MSEESAPSKQENKVAPIKVTCPCGKTAFASTVDPLGAGTCHCNECRILTQGIACEAIVYPGGTLQVTTGQLSAVARPDMKMTVYACPDCKCMLYHNEINNLDVVATSEIKRCYGGSLPDESLTPSMHCWYRERVYDVADGLPKFAGMPGASPLLNTDGTPVES
jgi:hypothetical protein